MSNAVVDVGTHCYLDLHVDSVSRVYESDGMAFVVLGSFTGIRSDGKAVMKEQVRLVCSRPALARLAREMGEASEYFATDAQPTPLQSDVPDAETSDLAETLGPAISFRT